MSHDTDCRVLDEYRDEVNEIAEMFMDGHHAEAKERAEDLGWEFLGEGVSRTVYRVTDDQQDGPVEDATQEAPCVIKFHADFVPPGEGQNASEYRQYDQFPEEITDPDGGVPLVVPIRDRAGDFSWLSMPEAEQGGETDAMIRRLAQEGWKCEDIHSDNVGELHGLPAMLDYGLDCGEASRPETLAEELERELFNVDAHVRTTYPLNDGSGGWKIQFWPKDWVLPNLRRPVDPSTVHIDGRGVITDATFIFAGYNVDDPDADPPEALTDATEHVVGEVTGSWLGVRIRPKPIVKETHVSGKYVRSIAFQVSFRGTAEMPPEILAELWEDVATEVKSEFPDDPTQGGRPSGALGDIEHDIEQAITEETAEEVATAVENDIEQEMDDINERIEEKRRFDRMKERIDRGGN